MELHIRVRILTGWFIMPCHSYYTSRRFFFHDVEIFRTFTTVRDEKKPFSIPPVGGKMPQFLLRYYRHGCILIELIEKSFIPHFINHCWIR